MNELKRLVEEIVEQIVSAADVRKAIFEAIKLEEKFGNSKSIDRLEQYEKIIEGLIK